MGNWWESSDAEPFDYEELDELKEKISLTSDDIKGDFYVDWGDITDLAKSIMSNVNGDERDFTLNDYGIYLSAFSSAHIDKSTVITAVNGYFPLPA